ncbi:neprilysin-2-like [Stegodyphus dumicola]|uniref:neprilysin-2-like n=1 Tax=Stegodyphus dumicola TaxID=202533 RepID=UPI0015B1D5CB|nr:neprilysin-2-like [Stegodyphus dumicola]
MALIIMNIDFLMKYVCLESILTDNFKPRPDVCMPSDTNLYALPRTVSSISEICLAPKCSGQGYHLEINVNRLTSRLLAAARPNDSSNISSEYEYCLTPGCVKADLLEKELTKKEPNFIRVLKGVYSACMNESSLEKEDVNTIALVLRYLLGWPAIKGREWTPAKFDWIDTVINLRRVGLIYDILFELSVTVDPDNSTAHIIKLGKPPLGIHAKHLRLGKRDRAAKAYLTSMETVIKELGGSDSEAIKRIHKAFRFEVLLANLSLQNTEEESTKNISMKYTIDELKSLIPEIDWHKYFNGLLTDEISENDIVMVEDIDFVMNVASLINKTRKNVLADYMVWRAVDGILPSLSKKFRSMKYKPRNAPTKERWEECLSFIQDKLGVALSSYYVRNYITEENKEAVQEYVDYIQSEFIHMLRNTEWISSETKETAIEKVYQLTQPPLSLPNLNVDSHGETAYLWYIGYPKELLNDSYISDLYKDLRYDITRYFEVRRNIIKWSTDYSFSLHRKPNVKGKWNDHSRATDVQVLYNEVLNSIDIPSGILQLPIFFEDGPHYLNFGSLGQSIGHEITRVFDNRGRLFDKDGIRRNWWDPKDENAYNRRAQCFIEQYSNFTAENGMQVNGVNTQEENIADNTALKAAYLAYQSLVKDRKIELKLPGLTYTPNQLFWIYAANMWCEKLSPETLKKIVTSGTYSPSKFRVIGPMSNLPEFAKDFQCNATSSMVRENRCQVW